MTEIPNNYSCLIYLNKSQFQYKLKQQTVCENEDIIHELGYHYYQSDSNNYPNKCIPILVPICLSKSKTADAQNEYLDENKMSVSRVFKTIEQCKSRCLLSPTKRKRRNAYLKAILPNLSNSYKTLSKL